MSVQRSLALSKQLFGRNTANRNQSVSEQCCHKHFSKSTQLSNDHFLCDDLLLLDFGLLNLCFSSFFNWLYKAVLMEQFLIEFENILCWTKYFPNLRNFPAFVFSFWLFPFIICFLSSKVEIKKLFQNQSINYRSHYWSFIELNSLFKYKSQVKIFFIICSFTAWILKHKCGIVKEW